MNDMQEYSGFAYVYDMFMDNVPYDEWTNYLHGLLIENGVNDGLVLDLGCGTGNVTRRLRDVGYNMIGVDLSPEMLQIAIEKENVPIGTAETGNEENPDNREILYLNQDMREFELYGSVAAIVSICDSMNYITSEEDLMKVFRLAENYLDPNGVFIFDMNTEYYYRNVLGEQTICENRDEGSFIWENYYDEESGINEFDMTIFVDEAALKKQKDTGVFHRYNELHRQKAYRLQDVRKLLKKAGFGNIRTYAALSHEAPNSGTERVYFVAERIRQQISE